MSSSPADPRRAELEALLVLDTLPGVGPATLRKLVSHFGTARRTVARGAPAVRELVGVDAATRLRDPRSFSAARAALREAERLGMTVLISTDARYPDRFRRLADPPHVLFLRGATALTETPGIAVVGSRRATSRARDTAARLGRAIAGRGVPVVSGLALGVDGAAHAGALDVGGPTIAVMGRGADQAYPRTHTALFRRVLAEGLIVSEFAPKTPPRPHHFPRRNRLLAALCDTVVVVEAGARSGALITVDHALDLGLDVWAVPGPIDAERCAGSNALLGDGARALVSVEGFVGDVLGETDVVPRSAADAAQGEARLVLEHLGEVARGVDDLAQRSGLGVGRTLAVLSGMELRGWVTRSPGMRFRRAS